MARLRVARAGHVRRSWAGRRGADAFERRHLRNRHISAELPRHRAHRDRKSTRLNSSHANTSYAAFCVKKKSHAHAHDSVVVTMVHALCGNTLSVIGFAESYVCSGQFIGDGGP